ncbi:hypothetical protein J2Z40_002327 [Cytobacillus eiseniae]|uniref:Uncharacterized protein n=1 Tax=Cytobacillus eiseniae TaxID=762947 RepID=A0ABS4RHB3_9BACI|nr:hypothetical protein [Cytobacillus eiseniae]MBP2241755.1 hypothetical protein [Cytobacillus eiseniae]
MIRMDNIPEHIKASLQSFYKTSEKPDVFPSKFQIDGELYYYFAFAPAAEQLIMREDGGVPRFHQVQREALIFNSYNTSIETIIHIGNKWVKSGKKGKYEKLKSILHDLKDKLPVDLANAYETYLMTADTILENQTIIDQSVKRAKAIWDRTNAEELATEQDQIEMRKCIVEMTRAAYKQNEIQLRTENEREIVWKYVSSKRWSIGLGQYLKLMPYQKNMMKNTPENRKEAEELGKMVLGDDLPLEQHENAKAVWEKLRNPR